MTKAAALVCLLFVACGSPPEATHAQPPPVTSATPAPSTTSSATTDKPVIYSGHGADSVPAEVIAKFAPPPLPGDVSRHIQAMVDVRAPVASRIAPDGKSIFLSWTVTGTPQVWKVDGPRRFPVQLTGGEDVTRTVAITPDGKWLVIARDRKGEENPGLYLLSVDGGALKEIQHKAKVQTQHQHLSDDGRFLYYRANDVKPDSYAIYKYELATGTKTQIFAGDGNWTMEDMAGTKLLLAKATGALTSEYYELDEPTKKLTPLIGQNEKEEYEAFYSATPGELLVRTPKFGEFRRIYRVAAPKGGPLDAAQAKAVTPDVKFDVSGAFIDHPRKHVYYTVNEGGYTRAHVLDANTFTEQKLPAFPQDDHVTFGAPSWDGRYVSIAASGARRVTTSLVWDWQTQKLVQWVVPSTPEIDTSKFAVPTLESYPARDGTKIPMFVRRPPSCNPAPCPVLVNFHGGPEGQALAGMSLYSQLYVDAGFVVVQPNVRGSDGYGKTWLKADDGPKRLQVITDIEDAAKYVRTAFAANGKAPKVGVFGGSYGGYSTLVAMTRFAGAFDAGVANVGMSNLLTFLLNTAPYRRALRASEYGDPEKDKATLLELSPITYIDKVNAPLLLIQGASDPRVPIGEALQMHAALEKRGQKTKMIVFPDEGHGAQKRENRVLEIGHTIDFFEVHLKGKSAR